MKRITKTEAIEAYGGNASELARALGITPQAIYQWPEGDIAEAHDLKLRFVLLPDRAWGQEQKAA
jgi:transposase-like protein